MGAVGGVGCPQKALGTQARCPWSRQLRFKPCSAIPPLLRGEKVELYDELIGQFARIIEPKDMIEWWWVKDITDHCWEIRRLRRFKVLLIELGRDEMYRWHEAQANLLAKHDAYEPPPMPDSERTRPTCSCIALASTKVSTNSLHPPSYDGPIPFARLSIVATISARRLRKASDEIIYSEFAALPRRRNKSSGTNTRGAMTSEAKIAANRRNAERSTGPRTASAKARVRRNALRHGLAALVVEDPAVYG